MIEWLEREGAGERRVNYKLRDWLFSRQRYWGEPFPIVFVDGAPQARSATHELPVLLPELEEFKPSGTPEGPLATVERLARDQRRRERQARPARDQHDAAVGRLVLVLPALHRSRTTTSGSSIPKLERYWMPVDLYVGGSEHAVLHLLYARFWHKVLYDAGVVSTPEPFRKLVHQGMILGELEFTLYRGRAMAVRCPPSRSATAATKRTRSAPSRPSARPRTSSRSAASTSCCGRIPRSSSTRARTR